MGPCLRSAASPLGVSSGNILIVVDDYVGDRSDARHRLFKVIPGLHVQQGPSKVAGANTHSYS